MRFTIRDLMWLMVVVALYLGWSIQQRQAFWQRQQDYINLAARGAELKGKNVEIAVLQQRLAKTLADERAARQELAEFVESQDDRAKIDVAPGLFHRVTAPR